VYAVSKYRIATHSQDWTSGGGEVDAFVSAQPDPNWCDNDCHPYLSAGVALGEMTNDGGLTYSTISGDMVCKSFLDSVQNFDLGGGWDWTNFGAPFDDTLTMGLYVNSRVVGAVDVPELANVYLEILEFEERNGDPVTGWYFGEIVDNDLSYNYGGAVDTVVAALDISTAFMYGPPANNAGMGVIKVPFGCGYDGLINVWATYGASGHGFWDWTQFWDTLYNGYMISGPGTFSEGPIAGDGEAYVNIAQKDFGGFDTLSFGVARFLLPSLADASDPASYAGLANLVNKWAGGGRGDMNNDNLLNLSDIILLAGHVAGGPGAVPFKHLGDVNADGGIDALDVDYMLDFYFRCGPCPIADWVF
ncbi:MAG: hypothetical protein AB1744_13755, partial [Candidatus Zixiibacteriota bacterium]